MGVYLYPNNTETPLKDAYIGIPNPTSMVLDKSSISLTTIGDTAQLTATLTPSVCDDTITWTSSDTTIATVDSTGLVTCVTVGECTITATTVNSLTATCSVAQGLPSEYQEVEYIQSSGTQYIDTNLSLGSNNFNIDLDFSLDAFNSQEQAICSIWTSTYNYWNLFVRDSSNQTIDCYTAGHNQTSTISTSTKYNLGLTRSSSTWTISLDGTDTTWSYSPGSTNNTTLKLFTRGDVPGTSSSNTHIKMYYCKVYIAGILFRDFVPCYRINDTEIGMYDLVNGVFYTNQGSGTFSKGADV